MRGWTRVSFLTRNNVKIHSQLVTRSREKGQAWCLFVVLFVGQRCTLGTGKDKVGSTEVLSDLSCLFVHVTMA